ncbi:SEN34 [Candida theae]|uniref:tRNA-intron lyase n=1 Tax=Candida theae TaxID=1198502 RepID=A0AAD5BGN8_9ASCO|nr:SEN34 [Candida theae]KAI5960016.1 SEN34 [Candida theae]
MSNVKTKKVPQPLDPKHMFDVVEIDKHTFRGVAPLKKPRKESRGVYGGNIAAQCVVVAMRSAPPGYTPNSLHSYFLKAVDEESPLVWKIDDVSTGKSFATRNVLALQNNIVVFSAVVSLTTKNSTLKTGHKNSTQLDYSVSPVKTISTQATKDNTSTSSVLPLLISQRLYNEPKDKDSYAYHLRWGLKDDSQFHQEVVNMTPEYKYAALAALSDWTGTELLLPHMNVKVMPQFEASIDHNVYFHEDDFDIDQWFSSTTHLHNFSEFNEQDDTITNMENDTVTYLASPAPLEEPSTHPIHLPVIDPSSKPEILVFNLDDIKQLRNKYHILGVLIGTLQHYPQQNMFLSVPLKLNVYEALWLVQHGYAILIDQAGYRDAKLKHQEEQLQGKTRNNNLTAKNILVVENSESLHDTSLAQSFEVPIKSYLSTYFKDSDGEILAQFVTHYKYYKYLQDHGYYINPGLKFGGDLVIYPGDPLRYHSYSIVKFDVVDMYDIIVGGRLATSVKKNMILMEMKGEEKSEDKNVVSVDDGFLERLFSDDDGPMCFSIEWAGFG